jgi:hypothetical protein
MDATKVKGNRGSEESKNDHQFGDYIRGYVYGSKKM